MNGTFSDEPCLGGGDPSFLPTDCSPNAAISAFTLAKSGFAGYSRPMLKRAAILLFIVSLAVNSRWVLGPIDWTVLPALLIGWFLADLASGVIHMALDYLPCPPGIGLGTMFHYPGSRESDAYLALRRETLAKIGPFQRLVFDFKNHHPRPDALGRRSFLTLVGSTIFAVGLPVSLLLNAVSFVWPVPGWFMAGATSLLVGGVLAQYFHGTLHRDDIPAIVRMMRRMGLLMTPAAHQIHHDSLQRDFATNCGWSNPFINPVFRFLHRRGVLTDQGLEPI